MRGGRTSLYLPGQPIGNRFRVERLLGRGGAGSVLAATDLLTGRRVALKLLRSSVAGDPTAVERFRREALVLQAIDHPGVVSVEDAGALDDGTLYLALELLEGCTLAQRLREGRPILPQHLAPIVRGLCSALEAIHAMGVLHRDVKPGNIFLPEQEEIARASEVDRSVVVKLVDFGLAKVPGLEGLTARGVTVGTARYMAPEQLTAPVSLDARVDVYATGVVLYEALSCHPAFLGTHERHPYEDILDGRFTPLLELEPELGAELAAVVERAMAKRPQDRFASAAALADAFHDAVVR